MGKADRYIERWRSKRIQLNPMINRPSDNSFSGMIKSQEQMVKCIRGESKLANDLLKKPNKKKK